MTNRHPTRRDAIKAGLLAGAGLAVGCLPRATESGKSSQIMKSIPSTGEQIPVIGLGTNQYGVSTPEEMAPLREVLRQMPGLGGKVIDTAPSYRGSEAVLGQLMEELGNRDQFFLSTKVTAPEGNVQEGIRQMESSFELLKTDMIDLVEVHNLNGTDAILPVMKEWKQAGRIRYIGVTTSSTGAHEALMDIMRREPLDFVQVNYSIGARDAGDTVLPLALDRGIAVMLNVPFGGRRGSVFGLLADKELPEWAAEFDCTSWAQFCLKYLVSHPAVTCPIPGTTDAEHLADNLGAAKGRLPDAAMRTRMEQLFDSFGSS
ncbi:MAG: aldo/keto reductase [Longimicrobiales bacterium]|nr:aldo/keto reductase [Longimicrobiales bacterium]